MSFQQNRIIKGVDLLTVALYVILLLIGLLSIFLVEFQSNSSILENLFNIKNNFSKQLYFAIICLFICFFILLIDSNIILKFTNFLYIFGIFLMVSTFFIGENINGSKSWLSIFGIFRLQPAELCKVFTSLAVAKFMSKNEFNLNKIKDKFIIICIIVLPAFISILQHELGQAIIYSAFLFALYREGLSPKIFITFFSLAFLVIVSLLIKPNVLAIYIGLTTILIIFFFRKSIKKNAKLAWYIIFISIISICFQRIVVPYIFNNMLECYQSTRIYSLIGKDYDCSLNKKENKKSNVRKPDNYNVRQSKIAIGSGGLFGKGFLKGTQTKGKYVPEQSTDFIFTSLGEAFGLIGCTLFLIIYLVFLMRILKIAENQRSPFSRIYGYCVVGFLFFHFTINVAMTIGLFPIVGIPLPFISYGGSSLFTFTILFSILIKLNIDKHRILK